MPTTGPAAFSSISQEAYLELHEAWQAACETARAAGEPRPDPPLNVEQRAAARDFFRAVQLRVTRRRQGRSAADIDAELTAEGLDAAELLVGPGGTGKSAIVHELRRQMQLAQCGELLVTAYTGVASAPFGGPTLLALLNLGIATKSEEQVPHLDEAKRERGRTKFFEESGVRVDEVGAIVLDEVSFVEARMLGHFDAVMRQLTGNLGIMFGGIPVLLVPAAAPTCARPVLHIVCALTHAPHAHSTHARPRHSLLTRAPPRSLRCEQAGDNHQKPPPGGSPWYHTLVADTVANDAVHQAANCGARSAEARGLAVLRRARMVELVRLMRAVNDAAFAAAQVHMRRTDVPQPVTDAFMQRLHQLSGEDLADDPTWRFAPIGVLSQIERDNLNWAQMRAFARAFDLPFVWWRLPLTTKDDTQVPREGREELYEQEAGLRACFVEGAPVNLTETIKARRKLVNGSPGLLYSLGFESNVPPELAAAYARGGYQEVRLEAPPHSVNVRVGRRSVEPDEEAPDCWHGVPLDNLDGLVGSLVDGGAVVPLLKSSNVETVKVHGIFAAQHNVGAHNIVPKKEPHANLKVTMHQYLPAFALTDVRRRPTQTPLPETHTCSPFLSPPHVLPLSLSLLAAAIHHPT